MGNYHTVDEVPGFMEHTLRGKELKLVQQAVDKLEEARGLKLSSKIYLVNNTKECILELSGYDCEWGLFWSQPEYAFENGSI